jgi:hypothetical protein
MLKQAPSPVDDLPIVSATRHQVLFDQLNYKVNKMIASEMFSSDRSKFKELIPPVLLKGVSIAALWANTFSSNSSFLREYHQRRKNDDLDFHPWDMTSDRSSGTRFFSCQTIVEVPRAGSFTLLNEAHRFAYSNCDGCYKLLLHISSQTPNVPAGGTFRCEAVIQVTADSPDGDCSVSVYGGMKKMSAMFSAIAFIATPRALKDMTTCYLAMMELVSEKLQGGMLTLKAAPAEQSSSPVTPIVPEQQRSPLPLEYSHSAPSAAPGPSTGLSVSVLLLAFCVVIIGLLSVSTMNTISASLQRANDLRGANLLQHSFGDERTSPLFSGQTDDACDGENDMTRGRCSSSKRTAGGDGESSSSSASPSLASLVARNEAALHRILAALHELNGRVDAAEQAAEWASKLLYVFAACTVPAFAVMYFLLKN